MFDYERTIGLKDHGLCLLWLLGPFLSKIQSLAAVDIEDIKIMMFAGPSRTAKIPSSLRYLAPLGMELWTPKSKAEIAFQQSSQWYRNWTVWLCATEMFTRDVPGF